MFNDPFDDEIAFSTTVYESFPVLDICSLLTRRAWLDEEGLSLDQKKVISEGIKFLDQVLDGYYSVDEAIRSSRVSGSSSAVSSFLRTEQVLRDYSISKKRLAIPRILLTARKVLVQIMNYVPNVSHTPFKNDLKLTLEVFNLLEKDIFQGGRDESVSCIFS
jgi:hypothetical protein